MANFSPLMLIAGAGLLKGTGIGVNRELTSSANTFTTSGISGAVQNILPNATPGIISTLGLAPSFLTGMPPAGILLPASFSITNVIGDVTNSAAAIMSGGAKGFSSLMGQVGSYAASTFGFQGALAQAQGMRFDDMGFQFANFQDIAGGGVTSQFNSATVAIMANDLPRLGTMFDITDLVNLSNPGSICANLIALGLGNVGFLSDQLSNQGLDVNNLANAAPELVTEVMTSISGSDLTEILIVTGFDPYYPDNIETLADVLNINNVFSPQATVQIGSFDELARKLSNIGGKFNSIDEMSSLYGGLELSSFPLLSSLKSVLPDNLVSGLSSLMGTGSGIFNNPTVSDMIGSVAGTGYTDDINSSVSTQNALIRDDSDVRSLKDYLDNNPSPDAGTLATLIENVNAKPGLQDVLSEANLKFINTTSNIANEKTNLSLAGINTGDNALAGSTSGVLSLSNQLHGCALDPMGIGLGQQLDKMSSDDVYGQALQASLQEGRNLSRFAVFGIDPGTKMDPMVYADRLKTMI